MVSGKRAKRKSGKKAAGRQRPKRRGRRRGTGRKAGPRAAPKRRARRKQRARWARVHKVARPPRHGAALAGAFYLLFLLPLLYYLTLGGAKLSLSLPFAGAGETAVPVVMPTDDLKESAEKQLEEFVKQYWDQDQSELVKSVVAGRPFVEIIQYARGHDIDLIVISTHGRGALTSMLLGSVTEKVVRKAPCAVLTVRNPEHKFEIP